MEIYGKQPLPAKNRFRRAVECLIEPFRDAPKTILITGGASGIGLGIAHETKKKYKNRTSLVLMGRNAGKGEAVMGDFTAADKFIQGDVLRPEDFITLLNEKIDVIVSNAGVPADGTEEGHQQINYDYWKLHSAAMSIFSPMRDFFTANCRTGDYYSCVTKESIEGLIELWRKMEIYNDPIVGIKFVGLVNCFVLAFLQRMIYGHRPRIVFVSSSTALSHNESVPRYSWANRWTNDFVRLTSEYHQYVPMAVVCPRSIDTSFLEESLGDEGAKQYREKFPPMSPNVLGEIIREEFIDPSNAFFKKYRSGREILIGYRESAKPDPKTGEYRESDIVFEPQWKEGD